MTPKEIWRLSKRTFEGMLPSHWVIRDQEDQEDYGIDSEIEIMAPGDRPTGFLFKIQSKGALELVPTGDPPCVALSGLLVEKIGYYLDQVPLPVAVVAIDVTSKKTYWASIKGNHEVERAYTAARSAGHETMTIHFPIPHELPSTFDSLLQAMERSSDAMLAHGIANVPTRRLVDALGGRVSLGEFGKALQEHYDHVRLDEFKTMVRERAFTKAQDWALRVLASPSESVRMRFSAGWNLMRLETGMAVETRDARLQERVQKIRHSRSADLLAVVRHERAYQDLRLFARFMARAARFRDAVERDFGVFMSREAQKASPDAFSRLITEQAQRLAGWKVTRELQRIENLLVASAERGSLRLLPQAWAQIVQDIAPFIMRLRADGVRESAQSLLEWADRIGEFAFVVAKGTSSWEDVALCAVMHLQLQDPQDPDACGRRFLTARERAEAIGNEALRRQALDDIEKYPKLWTMKPGLPTVDEEVQMRLQMAKALGVDLDDASDPIAEMVNIGLRDLNPERVLKDCQYLFVSIGPGGVPAKMFGLPTAGSKWVHCTKFGYGMMASALDDAYESFKSEFCSHCEHCTPRAGDWKWSLEWQREQDEQFRDVATAANRALGGGKRRRKDPQGGPGPDGRNP